MDDLTKDFKPTEE